ncbi:hypothetical protein JCM5353_008068 [Sporobolomyces roseus]
MSIQFLPHEILFRIFEFTISVSKEGEFAYGANVASWDSNGEAIAYRLVCKAWSEPAFRVAFRSVALFHKTAAQQLLGLLAAQPSRSIVYLAIGASEWDDQDLSLEENSDRLLIEAIEFTRVIAAVSSSLTHLHLHPLHVKARDFLLPAIRTCRNLNTLVISPRFQSWDGSSWGHNAFSRTDVVEFSLPPLLERLELDFASTWSAPFPIISSQAQPNSIKTIWLNCDSEEHALWQVLTSSESLEFCQLYFERLLEREGTVQALLNSTSTMKRLHFTSNPTIEDLTHFDSTAVPIFDLLLPRYLQLETLIVTATELSCRLFRLLPRSLRYLEITSLNDQARFFMDLQLLRDLEDTSLEITLEELVVKDTAQVYDQNLIQEFYERCTARGIIFTFQPDSPAGSSMSDS